MLLSRQNGRGSKAMSNRALALLIWLQLRARVRRSVRGARTTRGAIFLALGVVVILLWIGPSLVSAYQGRRTDPEKTATILPLLLLAMFVSNVVTTAGERAVAFTPAEVDLLFAAPFTRRQLLLYRLARAAVASVSAALVFSVVFLGHASFWLAAFVGMLLSLLLLQLLSVTVVLVGQTVGERAFTRGRRLLLAVVLLGAAALVVPLLKQPGASFFGIATQLRDSTAGRVVLAPFAVFARVMTAPSVWPDLAQWAAVALGLLALLLTIVVLLDAHYLEVSAAAGQKLYDRVQRMRRSGGPVLRTTGGARLRVPMPPRLAGAGPIAWRQLTTALRQSRSLLILLTFFCLVAGPAAYAGGFQANAGAAAGITLWLTVVLANSLQFDFRGDVDHIDALKALPLSATAVAAGQLVAPVVVTTLLQFAVLAGFRFIVNVPAAVVVAVAVVAVPFNAVLYSVENLFFLLFPGREAAGPGDLQGFGRQMVGFMLKMISLLVAAGIAGGAGAVVNLLTGSQIAAVMAAVVALWVEALAMIPLIVLAYRRFDPSADTPV